MNTKSDRLQLEAEIDKMFQQTDDSGLSEWEVDFLKSVRGQWGKIRHLSEKQLNKLRALWRRQNEKPKRP